MTASPHVARSLDDVLGQALDDLEGGLTPSQVLDRYPEYETELGSLVETAHRLRTTRWPVLSLAARVSGRERMHAALAEHQSRRHSLVPPIWRQLGAGLALAVLAGTTYFASPISPLRSMNRSVPTATLPIVATATWPVPSSPTWQPPAIVLPTATPLPSATLKVRKFIEPTEAFDLVLPAEDTPTPSATTQPSATPTRATPTLSPSYTPTSTPTPGATASPAPTAAGPSAPSGTSVAPSATPTAAMVPATITPVGTSTAPATATATRGKPTPSRLPAPTTPAPTVTVAPSLTPKPAHTAPPPTLTPAPETPIPTETVEAPWPTRTRRRDITPEATYTIEPTQLPKATDTPSTLTLGSFLQGLRGDGVTPGQDLRAALLEWRRAHLPGVGSSR